MREIRLALLEADVNFKVVKEFVAQVRERALGPGRAEEPDSRPAGREDRPRGADRADGRRRLGAGLRRARADGDPARRAAGLGQDDGRGQAGALPAQGEAEGRFSSPPTCSARPRSTSSSSSASRSRSPSTRRRDTSDPVAVAREGIEECVRQGCDVVIVDTAGRLHVDEEMMASSPRVRDAVKPHNILLVLDAMTGQEAVNVAAGVPGAGRLRRRRHDQARRRRPRRRGALGQGGHRQADQVRLGGREARPARALPPRADGLAHPRHGRRPLADRAGRAGGRRGRAGRDGSAHAARPVHASRTS